MKQFELGFEDPVESQKSDEDKLLLGRIEVIEPEEETRNRFEDMTTQALTDEYKKRVGVSPRFGMTREDIITALKNPEAERQRLWNIDAEEDKRDLRENYVR